jgi:hypothetical protein
MPSQPSLQACSKDHRSIRDHSESQRTFLAEATKMKAIDRKATDTYLAFAAAVRGASTRATAEPPPDFTDMSNAEGRQKVIENYGFDPGW